MFQIFQKGFSCTLRIWEVHPWCRHTIRQEPIRLRDIGYRCITFKLRFFFNAHENQGFSLMLMKIKVYVFRILNLIFSIIDAK